MNPFLFHCEMQLSINTTSHVVPQSHMNPAYALQGCNPLFGVTK